MGSLTTSQAISVGAIVGASMMVILALVIAYYVFYIIAFWKIFEKAGEAGWKSIIPFYNMYIQYKITWDVKWFWVTLVLIIVGGAFSGVGDSNSILTLIGGICMLVACVIVLIDFYYLSVSYGHGAGYFIGLVFLEFIFTLILGFGSSQYVGPAGKKE